MDEITINVATAKVLFLSFSTLLGVFLNYIGLDNDIVFFYAILLLMDYGTGLLKAIALKESITSNKMKYGIISKMILLIIPLALAITATMLKVHGIQSILFIGISILSVSELYSIIGNVYSIRQGKEFPEIEPLAILGKRIEKILEGLK